METEYTDQQPKASVSIQSLFGGLPAMKKSRGMGPRQALICKIAYELGIPAQFRSGLYFQTKDFTDQEILSIRDKAIAWKTNPAAFFRKLVKEKRLEIKNKLKLMA